MKISNCTNCYPFFLKKNMDVKKEKISNNNLDNLTNPFGTFYNFQAINSITFMGRVVQRPPFYVVDEHYKIVEDEQGEPMEFTSIPAVGDRLKLTQSEQYDVNPIFNKTGGKTFSHKGIKYTCVLKDDVIKDGEIDKELVKSQADKMFIHGSAVLHPPFYLIDENYKIVEDEQGEPMEFISVPSVKDRLELTSSERSGLNSIFDKNKNIKTFSHEGIKYTCVLKDDVIKDGEIDKELVKSQADKMFVANKTSSNITVYAPFYVVDEHCKIVKNEQGEPMEFASAPAVGDRLGLPLYEQNKIHKIFNKKASGKTFSHEGIKYTCILKDKISNPDGSVDNDMLKNEAKRMFNRKKTLKGQIQ